MRLGAEASTGQQGPPQALTTVGRPTHHRRGDQARHVQAGERKRRSPHQCLEYTIATSLLSLEFQAICTSFVLAFTISRNNKGVCFTCLFFGELSGPSRARKRTNTEVRLALPSAKPSLPRGLLRGEPPNVPKKLPMFFFEKFPLLSFSHTWEKRTRGISNYGTRPAELWGRLRLRDTAPPSPPHA